MIFPQPKRLFSKRLLSRVRVGKYWRAYEGFERDKSSHLTFSSRIDIHVKFLLQIEVSLKTKNAEKISR